eukprot:329634-Rhodomonas_salina.1
MPPPPQTQLRGPRNNNYHLPWYHSPRSVLQNPVAAYQITWAQTWPARDGLRLPPDALSSDLSRDRLEPALIRVGAYRELTGSDS